jgi:hypothetical protein
MAQDAELERVRTLSRVLDTYMIDPLLGLVLPGAGDLLGSLLGLYTVVIAARRKVSPLVIARMLLNLGIDAAVGVVPLVGDVVDFGFKANRKNVELLTARSARGGRATARDWLVLGVAVAAFAGVIALVCWGITALVRALWCARSAG